MKKFLLLTFFILISQSAFAEDVEFNLDTAPNANFMGQEQITDQDFEKTMKHLESKQKKNKVKKFKGSSLKEQSDALHIQELQQEPTLLNLPVNVVLENGKEIPTGHYKVVGKKTRRDTVVEFHQGHSIIASVPVFEIDEDFNERGIHFVKILPYSQNQVKLIYGSIDFNAYAILYFTE